MIFVLFIGFITELVWFLFFLSRNTFILMVKVTHMNTSRSIKAARCCRMTGKISCCIVYIQNCKPIMLFKIRPSFPCFFKLIIVQFIGKILTCPNYQTKQQPQIHKKKRPGVVKSNDVKYLCFFWLGTSVIVTKIWELLNDRKLFVLNPNL